MAALSLVNSVLERGEEKREDHYLQKVEEVWGEVLTATDLTEFVEKDSDHAVSAGAFGDIFKGTYYPNSGKSSMKRWWGKIAQPSTDRPIPVAIKVVRSSLTAGPRQEESKKVNPITGKMSLLKNS